MPITLPKDSALYTAPPAKIGASSPMDMAGTDYGVQAFKPTATDLINAYQPLNN